MFFFFKQKTAYEMRISDWSSDVCSSDLIAVGKAQGKPLDHGGLAHAGLASKQGIILATPHQNVDDLPDFLIAPRYRVDLARPGTRGQIHCILSQGHGALRGLAGVKLRSSLCACILLRGTLHDLIKLHQQQVRHNLLELGRYAKRSEERRVGKECVSTGRSRW